MIPKSRTYSGVVFQDRLVDDTRTRRPEFNSVLLRSRLQEIENLRVVRNRLWQICIRTSLTHDKVVAVNTSRHRRSRQPTAHELQKRHLRTRILHGHSVRLELQVRLPSNIPSIVRVGQQ